MPLHYSHLCPGKLVCLDCMKVKKSNTPTDSNPKMIEREKAESMLVEKKGDIYNKSPLWVPKGN